LSVSIRGNFIALVHILMKEMKSYVLMILAFPTAFCMIAIPSIGRANENSPMTQYCLTVFPSEARGVKLFINDNKFLSKSEGEWTEQVYFTEKDLIGNQLIWSVIKKINASASPYSRYYGYEKFYTLSVSSVINTVDRISARCKAAVGRNSL
jgi:hypothetical protein